MNHLGNRLSCSQKKQELICLGSADQECVFSKSSLLYSRGIAYTDVFDRNEGIVGNENHPRLRQALLTLCPRPADGPNTHPRPSLRVLLVDTAERRSSGPQACKLAR